MHVVMESTGLTYDDEQHRYFYNDQPVLGVTAALRLAGIGETGWGSDYDLWMGQARHKAIELWVNGTLDLSTVHADILPSVEAYLEFEKVTGFKPTHSEYKVYNPYYRVGGRVDLLGEFPDGGQGIIDLKSGSVGKPTALQLAIYDMLLGAQRHRSRYGLSVPKTGKPKVVPFTDRDDYTVAASVINVANWKIRHLGAQY